MSDTNFIDHQTPIVTPWLQDVNDTVYKALGAPKTIAQAIANLGVAKQSDLNTTNNNVATNTTSISNIESNGSRTVGSDLVGFLPAGTGAVGRKVQDKLDEFVSVKDFGAKGDGTTDDTAAIQAALDYVGSNGGGTVILPKTSGKYRITSTIKLPSYTTLTGAASDQFPFNSASNNSCLLADFSNINQWVIEPKTTSGGASVAYNTVLIASPDGATYNVGVKNLSIQAVNTVPYGGIRIHGSPGAIIDGVSILGTGYGILLNETWGGKVNAHTETAYYGVVAWNDVNAYEVNVYSDQWQVSGVYQKTVPTGYLFSGLNSLNGNMVNTLHLSTEAHYDRAFGLVLGSSGSTSSSLDISVTSEYFSGAVFMYNAKAVNFKRTYIEGGSGQVDFGVVAAYASFTTASLHSYMTSSGSLFDLGTYLNADIAITGVISYSSFGTGPYADTNSFLKVRGVSQSGCSGPASANILYVTDPAYWTVPTLGNTWAQAASPWDTVSYRKNPQTGNVELKGTMLNGTVGSAAFTLPAGYRPAGKRNFPQVSGTALGVVIVLATGDVIPASPTVSANGISLDGIFFKAEN